MQKAGDIIVIFNRTENTILAHNAILADSFISRLKGLLGKKLIPPGEALIIYPCKQIHSAFMQFSFDALFLDPDFYVLHAEQEMPPFKVSPLVRKACMVVELPAGTIKETKTQVGDKMIIEEGCNLGHNYRDSGSCGYSVINIVPTKIQKTK